jgi:hypothetical protein
MAGNESQAGDADADSCKMGSLNGYWKRMVMLKANEEGKGKQQQGFLVPCSCEARRKEPPAPCLGGQRRFDVISFDFI